MVTNVLTFDTKKWTVNLFSLVAYIRKCWLIRSLLTGHPFSNRTGWGRIAELDSAKRSVRTGLSFKYRRINTKHYLQFCSSSLVFFCCNGNLALFIFDDLLEVFSVIIMIWDLMLIWLSCSFLFYLFVMLENWRECFLLVDSYWDSIDRA